MHEWIFSQDAAVHHDEKLGDPDQPDPSTIADISSVYKKIQDISLICADMMAELIWLLFVGFRCISIWWSDALDRNVYKNQLTQRGLKF